MTDYTIEAEDLQLDGYEVKSNSSDASGGSYIQTDDGGTASTTFEGEAGVYSIDLSMFDENDGASTVELLVNGQVVSVVVLDQDDGGNYIEDTLTNFSLTDVELQPGDTIELRSSTDDSEFARIDKIELTLVEPAEGVDPALIGENVVLLEEDFNGSDSVESSDLYLGSGYAGTNASWDGDLEFQTVSVEGYTNGKISLDMGISLGGFEEWGTKYGDMLSIELIDQDGNVHVLDLFTGSGDTLTGTHTGQTINGCVWGTYEYDIPAGVTSFQLLIQSHISANCEIILLDNVVITADELLEPDPIPLIDAVDDMIVVSETEGAGDTDINVLANDISSAGDVETVFKVEGQTALVGEWIDLADGGRVRIDENGDLDFDADGDFDALNDGESATVDLTYSIAEVVTLVEEAQDLDFNEFAAGTVLTDQLSGAGVTISSASSSKPVMIFDTDNVTGGDSDLATSNLGKVLIISEDGDSSDPDDNAGGGTFIFEFDRPAQLDGLSFLDTEEPGATIRLYDENGDLIDTIQGPVTADGGQASLTFDIDGVAKMEVELQGSGAIDNLLYTLPSEETTIVEDQATVTIQVNGEDDVTTPPVAEDDLAIIDEDGGLSPTGAQSLNILANDSDADGDTLVVSSVAGGAVGAAFAVTTAGGVITNVTVDANGDVTFDTAGLFDGLALGETDSFQLTYTVDDGNGGTDTAIVTVEINGLNEPPTATDNSALTDEETAVSGNILTDDDGDGVDSDPNGDSLSVSAVSFGDVGAATAVTTDSGAFSGTLTVSADGSYTFVPGAELDTLAANDTETVTFTYEVSDGLGGTDTAEVVITIDGLNEDPDAVDDAVTIPENGAISVADDTASASLNILENDSDPNGDPLTILSIVTNRGSANAGAPIEVLTLGGVLVTVTVTAAGDVLFETNGAFDDLVVGETDSFVLDYEITDPFGGTDTASVTVTIDGLNDPPNAENDATTISEAGGIGASAAVQLNVLDNDSDPNGDDLIVTEAGGQAAGTVIAVTTDGGVDIEVVVNADGTVEFDTNNLFDDLNDGQTDSFTIPYTASEDRDGGETDSANLTVTIEGEGSDDTGGDGPSYNIVFLVDSSSSTSTSGGGGDIIGSDGPLDLNGDGVTNTMLDAELHIAQQLSNEFAAGDPNGDFEISVYSFSTERLTDQANTPAQLLSDGDQTVFNAGDDLTGAFNGVVSENNAAYNTAVAGAGDFFTTSTANDGDTTVNLVYLITDGGGLDLVQGGDDPLFTELSELNASFNADVDVIATDTAAVFNPFIGLIEGISGDGQPDFITNEAGLDTYLTTVNEDLIV